jgi:hypothetical protein
MSTFIATFIVLALLMAIMAVGVLFGGRRLRGSCGGVANRDCSCSLSERRECQRRAAAEGVVPDDGRHHLAVFDDDAR